MTVLRRLMESRSLEDPQVPISSTTIWEELGYDAATDSGEHVSPEKVLGIPAVLRGARILAGTWAGLPLKVRDQTDAVARQPWQDVSPSTGQTWFERMETAALHLVLWGEQFWLKVRKGNVIVDLVPIHPGRVRVDVVWLGREKVTHYKVFVIDGEVPLTSFEVMHVPGPSTDGLRGISPVSLQRQSLGISLAAERTAANLYGKGMFAAGILTTDKPLTGEQASTLKQRWAVLNGRGARSAGEVAVLDNGATFLPTTIPPGDAQFLESRKFSVTEIARWLGVPGWMLNDQEKSTSWGTGMEQQFTTWVMITVKPDAQRMEQRFTVELCTGDLYAEFVLEGLMRGDSASRAEYYASGIEHGWLVPNDIRPLENLAPVPWGNEPYRPYNEPAGKKAAPTASPDDPNEEDQA